MITTSGGGALICRNAEEANQIMWLATQARDAYPYYQHTAIGFNYRMSNVCAGIGRGQMTVLDQHIAHHKHVQKLYEELLADVPGITLHCQPECRVESVECRGSSEVESIPVYDSNYWLCTITIDENVKVKGQENAYKTIVTGAVGGAAGVIHAAESATTDCQPNENVEALRVALDAAGIEARPVWKPMHCQPVYKRAEVKNEKLKVKSGEIICQTSGSSVAYINGVSEALFKVGMCLPAGPYVTDDDVRYIVECIKNAIVG
jgi:dTDP-4-amino-4,6-dideoxygalactose transaminase